jgi:hypothetical protein
MYELLSNSYKKANFIIIRIKIHTEYRLSLMIGAAGEKFVSFQYPGKKGFYQYCRALAGIEFRKRSPSLYRCDQIPTFAALFGK